MASVDIYLKQLENYKFVSKLSLEKQDNLLIVHAANEFRTSELSGKNNRWNMF